MFAAKRGQRLLSALLIGTAMGSLTGGVNQQIARAEGAISPSPAAAHLPNFVNLVKEVKPAVVSITATIKVKNSEMEMQGGQQAMPFPFPFPFQMIPQQSGPRMVEARGSGFIISADGYVVTNNHVVKDASKVSVHLENGQVFSAKIIGRDQKTDLALLKVHSSAKLPFIQLGESNDVQPGEWVIAVGNPYGLGGTVTAGIVSARGRDIGDGPYDSFIQIDAPINRGNSGGPLFTQDGKVVGVNTAILSPSGGSIGIGFAIPSDVVKNVVEQLRKNGHVVRGFLGVTTQIISPSMAQALKLKQETPSDPYHGALVASVTTDSPADKAGIKVGDVILSVNNHKVDNPHDLAVQVAALAPKSPVDIIVWRNGTNTSLKAVIGNQLEMIGDGGQNGGPSSGNVGMALSTLSPDIRQQLGVDESVKGVVVREILPGSPADQAGLRPGDIIVSVNRQVMVNPKAAANLIKEQLHKNQPVLLQVIHDGQNVFVALPPGENSEDNSFLGEDGAGH
ncbi:Periplasmic serine endoprotease DegP [Entomobacter blattae]|uniref:Probable periplasmic serine endoprotease DegP-like n=2 Tax=Entomobacter blattae TaxID=2762277 RepID=A0A7H1NPL7_9PROT|nr:Periplasmic serine endoprotease DegP [Entomobacter blattae]